MNKTTLIALAIASVFGIAGYVITEILIKKFGREEIPNDAPLLTDDDLEASENDTPGSPHPVGSANGAQTESERNPQPK